MNANTQKLSVLEKFGYSLGDLAANLIFQTLVTFIAFFYTNVYGLAPGKANIVVLAAGLIGGVFFSPIMGIIADRTNTRWGKYRPWILWTSIPFGVGVLMAFTTPDLGENGKVIYAFVTYLLLVTLYTANNLPYSALSGVMTGNMAERNSLSAYRFTMVMVAQFIIQVLLAPMVMMVGDGDKAAGFEKVMFVFAVFGTLCFLITFITTKERIVPRPEQNSSVLQDLKDLIGNKPWLIMLLITILIFITLALKGGMYIYYFKYYVSQPELGIFLEDIGFNGFIAGLNNFLVSMGLSELDWSDTVAESAFGLFNGGGIILMIVGIAFSKPLADRFGKRDVFGVALFVSTLFVLAFMLFPSEAIGAMFISQILHGFFYGLTIPLLWAMIADVADYSEWKYNRRATAIIFSAMLLGLKAGLTLGSFTILKILAWSDFSAKLELQAPTAVSAIKFSVSLYPSIPFFIAAIACLFFYEINKAKESEIETDLKQRREA